MSLLGTVKSLTRETLYHHGCGFHRLPSNKLRADLLGLSRVFKDDTFIVSYPRSGNTWVRFLIANLIEPAGEVDLQSLSRYVPDIHREGSRLLIDSLSRPRFIKSHSPYMKQFPRLVYIYRDGRDAVVSFYHYVTKNWGFEGTFSEFLLSRSCRVAGHWHEHVNKAFAFADLHPEQILLVRYEDLREEPVEWTGRIAEFCRLRSDRDVVSRAVANCEFSRLKKMERKKQFDERQMFRSGKVSNWKEIFSPSDLRMFLAYAGRTLEKSGYSLDRNMDEKSPMETTPAGSEF